MVKDLTKGRITKTLLLFALPMLIGNLIQQIYNVADTIIVGKFISDTALASVGASFPVFFLLISILIGLATGAGIIISQLFGAGDTKNVKKSAYTALISAVILGVVVSVIGYFACPGILNLLKTPDTLFEGSKQYLQIIFLGTTLLFVYDMVTSTFNALGDSKTPLYFMIISAVLNIGLDLLFVLCFKWGIVGAALATVCSRGVATVLSLIILLKKLKKFDDTKLEKIYDVNILKDMTKVAIPVMLNQSLVAIGALAVQAVINGFGDNVIAGYTAASKVDTFAMMPIMNLSFALSTFVAQNMGAHNIDRAKKGFKISLIVSIIFAILMAIVVALWGSNIMGLFLEKSADPEIIEFGKNYLMVIVFGYIVMGFLFDAGAVLRASGAMTSYLISTIVSIGLRVVAAYSLRGVLGESVIWWSIIIGWATGAAIAMWGYLKGDWQKKDIVAEIENEE